jgi:hypothetical protein
MRTTIDSYKLRSGRLNLGGIEFDDFKDQPLAPDALRTLRYMHDIEHHTICYLRAPLREKRQRKQAMSTFSTIGSAAFAGRAFIALHMTLGGHQ